MHASSYQDCTMLRLCTICESSHSDYWPFRFHFVSAKLSSSLLYRFFSLFWSDQPFDGKFSSSTFAFAFGLLVLVADNPLSTIQGLYTYAFSLYAYHCLDDGSSSTVIVFTFFLRSLYATLLGFLDGRSVLSKFDFYFHLSQGFTLFIYDVRSYSSQQRDGAS